MCTGWFRTGILLARIWCFTRRPRLQFFSVSLYGWVTAALTCRLYYSLSAVSGGDEHFLRGQHICRARLLVHLLSARYRVPSSLKTMSTGCWWSSSHPTLHALSTLQIYFLSAERQSIGSYTNDPSGCHGCSSWWHHSGFCIGWIEPSKRFFPASLITRKDICWGVDENMQPNRGEGKPAALHWRFPSGDCPMFPFSFSFLSWMKWSVYKLQYT